MEKPYVPHSPSEFAWIIPKDRLTLPLDLFMNWTWTMVPFGSKGGGWLQGSCAALSVAVAGALIGINVMVGIGVQVGVGGSDVSVAMAVGSAACVRVTEIHALATAVLATSFALRVGTGAGPQAERSRMTSKEIADSNFLFIDSPF